MLRHRFILAFVVIAALVGGCGVAAWVHDDRARLSEDEFRERLDHSVGMGASEDEVADFLAKVTTAKPHEATIYFYAPKVVAQTDCAPRPCSLIDRGVEPGVDVVTARIENVHGWLPSICADEFTAFIIFDRSNRYSRILFEDASACL